MVHLGILLQQEEEKNREEIQMKPQLEIGEDNCSETFWNDRDDDYIIIRVYMWRWSTRKNRRYVLNKMKSIDLPKVRFSKHLSIMGFLWSLLFKYYAVLLMAYNTSMYTSFSIQWGRKYTENRNHKI